MIVTSTLRSKQPPAAAVVSVRSVGRARCHVLDDGRELWRFAEVDDPAAVRLAASEGLCGVIDAGHDDDGAWLLRSTAATRGDAWIDAGPHAWAEVCPVVRSLVDRLQWCEGRSLFPGRLRPHDIALDDDGGVHLRAESLLRSLCGAASGDGTGTPELSRWVPPQQAEGAVWDAAANRYVVGLLLYRALSGHHPFSGQGLRRGLEEQARRGAPPLPDEVARQLPPGVQSLCLSLLEADPSARPPSAQHVAERLAAIDKPETSTVVSTASRPAPASTTPIAAPLRSEPTPQRTPPRSEGAGRRWLGRIAMVLPVVAGLGLAFVLGSGVEPPPAAASSPSVPAAAPLSAEHTTSDDCAQCHPRQVAQWSQSVMAHSVRSPLFQGLEILIQEQVGKSFDCPQGAGILRAADPRTACREPNSGLSITGSGGELWCVNCHAAGENLKASLPAWDGRSGRSRSHQPLGDLLPEATMEGISCAVCHSVDRSVRPGDERNGRYEGNPTWFSFITGQRFSSRPEDRQGLFGIANSGYSADLSAFLQGGLSSPRVPGGAHGRPTEATREYLQSSEFCGACHDVRLFGTDVIGVRDRGEHFKRLRNAYSEWSTWADAERREGREPASCQDCHMSEYPGVCEPGDTGTVGLDPGATALRRACPPGTHFEPRDPGDYPRDRASIGSADATVTSHYFSGVDAPLTDGIGELLLDDPRLDEAGIPRGLRPRRDMLLGRTFRFEVPEPSRRGDRLQIPVEIENVGAGHRVPAGFSQEREIWVHMRVTDADGRLLYEVGRVDRGDEDLSDKRFVRINVDDRNVDANGAPLGVFGADVVDGPDVPRWSPSLRSGATRFSGEGLINLQNGFLRCVTCIGIIDGQGECQPGFGQGRTRSDRFADGVYDLDTGECTSNLFGQNALFEIYFPVGGLDSTRGGTRGPDAIIDSRSAPPGVPLRYTYDLPARGGVGPITVDARLLFRAFPPFLVRAFADYETLQAARGLRPSGPLVTHDMLERLEVVELSRVRVQIP